MKRGQPDSSLDDSFDDVADAAATLTDAVEDAALAFADAVRAGKFAPYRTVDRTQWYTMPWSMPEFSALLHSLRGTWFLSSSAIWLWALRRAFKAKVVFLVGPADAGILEERALPLQCFQVTME